MHQVTEEEAKTNIDSLLKEALSGEEILITIGGQTVTMKVSSKAPDRKPGSAKGQIWMSEDFDEPLEEFKEYM